MTYTKPRRLRALAERFAETFGEKPLRYFSAPGRTEICGNHTDHQKGRVLAAAVSLDTVAAAAPNGREEIRVLSLGYPLSRVDLRKLEPDPGEYGTTTALIRGMAAAFRNAGAPIHGFDAVVESRVLPGSGLSSSAAFEVLMGTILNGLFFGGRARDRDIALWAQQAENDFFGKPCGLMDQMASAVGGLVKIDFAGEAAVVTPLRYDFAAAGHALCIIDSRASHADLTDEYAAIPMECGAVAGALGKTVLSEVPEDAFYENLPMLRKTCGDRAVLRAMHVFAENRRVDAAAEALERGDFPAFLEVIRASGRSSFMYLQNVTPAGATGDQAMALTLGLIDHLLGGRGAFRVHGGGFAGTAQAFVPLELLEDFRAGVDRVLGDGACHILSIRQTGGVELEVEP